MSVLIELNLTYTNLKDIEFIDTDGLRKLEKLILRNNQISVLRKGVFSKLKNLKSLDLFDNKIQELVLGTFDGLECLEDLEISFNPFRIGSIDGAVFDELTCLKRFAVKGYKMVNIIF